MAPKLLFEDEGHSYFLDDGRDWWSIPSVTTILQSLGFSGNYDGVPPHLLEAARCRGIAMHGYIERHFSGMLMSSDIAPAYEPLMDSFFEWLEWVEIERDGVDVLSTEEMVWKDYWGLQVAGRMDMMGVMHHKDSGNPLLHVFDWKSRKTMYPSDRLQLTAYSHFTGAHPCLVLLDPKGGPPKTEEFDPDFDQWLSIVSAFKVKVECGLEKEYEIHAIPSDPESADR